jgi:site-specific DNA recombinase
MDLRSTCARFGEKRRSIQLFRVGGWSSAADCARDCGLLLYLRITTHSRALALTASLSVQSPCELEKGAFPRPFSVTALVRASLPALLKGIIYGPSGTAMSPTHTRKNGKLYRYYLSQTVLKQGAVDCLVARVPAAEIEKIVIDQVRVLLLSPEIIVQTWRNARRSIEGLTESDVRSSLLAFDPLWNELFPAEQSRIIELLVERVDVRTDRVDIRLQIDGVTSLLGELTGNSITQQDAA